MCYVRYALAGSVNRGYIPWGKKTVTPCVVRIETGVSRKFTVSTELTGGFGAGRKKGAEEISAPGVLPGIALFYWPRAALRSASTVVTGPMLKFSTRKLRTLGVM